MIEQASRRPDFAVSEPGRRARALSNLRGRHGVLYFYPKADTPGCTAQACGVRDRSRRLRGGRGGRARDLARPREDLRAFADKYGLAFTLLADAGARGGQPVRGMGREEPASGAQPSAPALHLLVDPDGIVARVFPNVKPAEHDDLVLGAREGGAA